MRMFLMAAVAATALAIVATPRPAEANWLSRAVHGYLDPAARSQVIYQSGYTYYGPAYTYHQPPVYSSSYYYPSYGTYYYPSYGSYYSPYTTYYGGWRWRRW